MHPDTGHDKYATLPRPKAPRATNIRPCDERCSRFSREPGAIDGRRPEGTSCKPLGDAKTALMTLDELIAALGPRERAPLPVWPRPVETIARSSKRSRGLIGSGPSTGCPFTYESGYSAGVTALGAERLRAGLAACRHRW